MSGKATQTSRTSSSGFSARLKEAQGAANGGDGITNEALARQMDVSLRVVQRWRDGRTEPSGEYLARLCLTLGRPVEFFYDDKAAA